jgi:hypothetical protein
VILLPSPPEITGVATTPGATDPHFDFDVLSNLLRLRKYHSRFLVKETETLNA